MDPRINHPRFTRDDDVRIWNAIASAFVALTFVTFMSLILIGSDAQGVTALVIVVFLTYLVGRGFYCTTEDIEYAFHLRAARRRETKRMAAEWMEANPGHTGPQHNWKQGGAGFPSVCTECGAWFGHTEPRHN